jgi:two-component system chemotaxis response regulator CheY
MAAPVDGKGRLLAIDDNIDSAELVVRIATKCGYKAQSVTDPDEFRRMLAEWKPDVLSLDLCMPHEDGMSLFSILEDSGFAGQLVIISGQDGWLRKTAARLAEARGLRVIDDFAKPVDIQALRRALTEARAAG